MNEERADTILVLLRAAGLPWPVAKTILAVRARRRAQSATDLAKSLAAFERLSPDTAKQIVEFYRQRRLGRRAETD
jgi:hypothetical protein